MNKYEEPFWKVFIRENWTGIFNPAALFMLVFISGLIALCFYPITVLLTLFGLIVPPVDAELHEAWFDIPMLVALPWGLIGFLSYHIGQEKHNHYVIRALKRLLEEGKIDEKVYVRVLGCQNM